MPTMARDHSRRADAPQPLIPFDVRLLMCPIMATIGIAARVADMDLDDPWSDLGYVAVLLALLGLPSLLPALTEDGAGRFLVALGAAVAIISGVTWLVA